MPHAYREGEPGENMPELDRIPKIHPVSMDEIEKPIREYFNRITNKNQIQDKSTKVSAEMTLSENYFKKVFNKKGVKND